MILFGMVFEICLAAILIESPVNRFILSSPIIPLH